MNHKKMNNKIMNHKKMINKKMINKNKTKRLILKMENNKIIKKVLTRQEFCMKHMKNQTLLNKMEMIILKKMNYREQQIHFPLELDVLKKQMIYIIQ